MTITKEWLDCYKGFSNIFVETGTFHGDTTQLALDCGYDVVNIVLNNKKQSGIYDLGNSNPVSFKYVAECVANKYNGEINYVPFPKHLVGKYQDFTCAKCEWDDYKFVTVEEYLK